MSELRRGAEGGPSRGSADWSQEGLAGRNQLAPSDFGHSINSLTPFAVLLVSHRRISLRRATRQSLDDYSELSSKERSNKMKANKTAMLTLALLSMVTTACSSSSPMENKLVGEWQSSGPESERLTIAIVGTDDKGFHDGFTSTSKGQTTTSNWRIKDHGDGPYLVLQDKNYTTDLTGVRSRTEYVFRINELTSDRFVLTEVVNSEEFHRVKPGGR